MAVFITDTELTFTLVGSAGRARESAYQMHRPSSELKSSFRCGLECGALVHPLTAMMQFSYEGFKK